MGAVSCLTSIIQTGISVSSGLTERKPELTPSSLVAVLRWRVHGSAKDDWVTVWFFGWNSKLIRSPTLALTVSGENTF